ncbi:uncharacterized protein LOC127078983 [Lathyrus oleraceus]|uniref:uncharacterized protein LOC127078983 n=1 Tax=Pisum sativum TaxID=3888 RepID=UPI0021D04D66|nr:uncharacterized protein LOC127078983 [Pisum sativum]
MPVSYNSCVLVCREMVGRNDQAIADAFESMAQMLQDQQNQASDEFCGLEKFQRNNQAWLRGIKKIFRVIACNEEQNVLFSTHMLLEEDKDRWNNVRQRLDPVGTDITWVVFRTHFLEKYFPKDMCSNKDIGFLELKQGNLTVAKYDVKFEEFTEFCPHYNSTTA